MTDQDITKAVFISNCSVVSRNHCCRAAAVLGRDLWSRPRNSPTCQTNGRLRQVRKRSNATSFLTVRRDLRRGEAAKRVEVRDEMAAPASSVDQDGTKRVTAMKRCTSRSREL